MTPPRLILVTLGRLTFEADLGARLAAASTIWRALRTALTRTSVSKS